MEFVIRNEQYVYVTVGGAVFRVCVIGAVGLVGVTSLSEAKQAVVDKFTAIFGKHQGMKEDSNTDASEIVEIEQNELDWILDVISTVGANKELVIDDDDILEEISRATA